LVPANFAEAFFYRGKDGAVRDFLTGQFDSLSIAERGH